MDAFRIKTLRPLLASGRAYAPGEVVALPALAAAQAIGAGRAELCDAGDEADMRAAINAEAVKACRGLGGSRGPAPNPWLPLPLH